MVAVFREVKRVLRYDGTLWLNLGDSYNGSGRKDIQSNSPKQMTNRGAVSQASISVDWLKPKDLIGIPWLVAFALRADGWYLRQDIIWAKPNPMPESVTDRCTKSHEYIFMLTKSARYYYNQEAIMEPAIYADDDRIGRAMSSHKSAPSEKVNGIRPRADKQRGHSRRHQGFNERWDAMERANQCSGMRNRRSVWNVAPAQFHEAHFATFPPNLIQPCVLSGCPPSGIVLDPFAGSGTTGKVALELGRSAILIELNPDYVKLIEKRCRVNLPLCFDSLDAVTGEVNVLP